MRNYIHFFAGGIFFVGVSVAIGLFRYTWLIDNLEKLNLIFFASFLIAAIVLVVLYFYIPFKAALIKKDILKSIDESIKPLQSSKLPLTDRSIQTITNISGKALDLIIEGRSRRLVIGGFLFIFATIVGSVGSILIYKQNALIKEQNTMLLRQYEGFIKQTNAQQQRWNKEDDDSLKSKIVALKREIISIHRETYIFSFDIAVLEKKIYPDISKDDYISVMIFDLWDMTADTIDTDIIKTKKQLEEAKLKLAQFEFIFQPANKRIQIMRGYSKKDQNDILLAIRGLLVKWLSNIKKGIDNKSDQATPDNDAIAD